MTTSLSTKTQRRGFDFRDVQGWLETDWTKIWPVFRRSAMAFQAGIPVLRSCVRANPALAAVLRAAAELPEEIDGSSVRGFLERHFRPRFVEPGGGADGLLTGYYEPVVDGSLVRSPMFAAPILPRPDDLVTIAHGEADPRLPRGYSAGRRAPDGSLAVYPDRAALEDVAVRPGSKAIMWIRDWTEVFLIHVQGSARVRFPNGSQRRLVYAGRNGHPYTSIGRRLIEAGEIAQEAMSLDTLKGWLRLHGQSAGQAGRNLMQQNRSYIFFRSEPVDATMAGPIGGAGLPLTPLRSIAVDRSIWPYGLPFWIETREPVPGFGPRALQRLFVAQDTGSAILGPARADLFLGSGNAAGAYAGAVRHAARFTALVPRAT